jgi:hypothetical protein
MGNADQLFLHGRSIAFRSENEDGVSWHFTREATRNQIDVKPDDNGDFPAGGCIACSHDRSAKSLAAGVNRLFSKKT